MRVQEGLVSAICTETVDFSLPMVLELVNVDWMYAGNGSSNCNSNSGRNFITCWN